MINTSEKFHSIQTFFQLRNYPNTSLQFPVLDQENSLDLVLDNCENNIDFFSSTPKDQETSQVREIQQTSLSSNSQRKTKKQGCHCKKTRYLKMYCECFSQGNICGKGCVCIGCHNDQKHHKDKYQKPKTVIKHSSQSVGQFIQRPVSSNRKGCNCKKSHCQKRYCQCLNAGIQCTESCQCVECNNCLSSSEHIQKYKSSAIEQKQKQEEGQINDRQTQQVVKSEQQMAERQKNQYIVMSNQLLAEIDGYITG